MRRGSLVQRYSYLVHLGIMLTQLLQRDEGFRLKDVKFYCNLVSNWISFDGQGFKFEIELMQIKRLLERLEDTRWVRVETVNKTRIYRLSRQGFLGLLASFRDQTELTSMEEVLLLFSTLDTYRPFLLAYLLPQGHTLDTDEVERVHELIDPDWFLENYIAVLDRRIQMIQKRIDENKEMSRFIQRSMEMGESFPSIVERVHRTFSYQMSYAKTFKELLLEIPEDLGRFELKWGLNQRSETLFVALRDTYEQRKSYLTRHLSAQTERRKRRELADP